MAKTVEGIEVVNKKLAAAGDQMLANVKTAVEVTLIKAWKHAGSNHGPGAHGQGRFVNRFQHLVQSIKPTEVTATPEFVEGYLKAGRAVDIEYAEPIEKGVKPHVRTSSKGKVYTHPGHRPYPFLFPALMYVHQSFVRAVKAAMKVK